MTKQEFRKKWDDTMWKLWEDSQKVISEMKANGTWVGGLGKDPPEIKRLHENALAKMRELWETVEDK